VLHLLVSSTFSFHLRHQVAAYVFLIVFPLLLFTRLTFLQQRDEGERS